MAVWMADWLSMNCISYELGSPFSFCGGHKGYEREGGVFGDEMGGEEFNFRLNNSIPGRRADSF